MAGVSKVYRGRIVHCINPDAVTVFEDALIGFDKSGKIVFLERGDQKELETRFGFKAWDVHQLTPSQFLMPGFVDTHIHAPQYRYTGTGYDKQLLDWLNTYTFPTEQKFADVALAHEVYPTVVKRTLNNGTTTASYFATIHLESTKELCKIIARYGQRALVGKVNMDVVEASSPEYIESTQQSIEDTVEFIEFVEGMKNPLIKPVITPRFIPTCSKDLMTQLAQIAKKKSLHIQSHLCEQMSEIGFTLDLFHRNHKDKTYKSCTEIFDEVGLLTDKTYMAHCIHLDEEELQLLKDRNVGFAHCPNSNFCLKSGVMDARDRLTRGLKTGLGTDVAGGFSSSILDAIRHAMHATNALHMKAEEAGKQKTDEPYKPLTLDEALYMATIGGAQVLNLENDIGNFQVGKQFDALLVDVSVSAGGVPVFDTFPCDSFKDILSKFLYLGDDRNIVKVFVAGNEVINKIIL